MLFALTMFQRVNLTNSRLVLEQPDLDGFFTVKNSWSDLKELCCILSYHDAPGFAGDSFRKCLFYVKNSQKATFY